MPTDEKRLPNEIKYLKNELKKLRVALLEIHTKDKELMESLDSHFAELFGGVENELKLLRTTLVLLLLANMPNRNRRKSFLRMVDFVSKESDFQEFADELYGGLINTKKLGDII